MVFRIHIYKRKIFKRNIINLVSILTSNFPIELAIDIFVLCPLLYLLHIYSLTVIFFKTALLDEF